MTLLEILIGLIVVIVVVYIAKLLLDIIELPPPIRQVALLLIGLVVLVLVFSWASEGNLALR